MTRPTARAGFVLCGLWLGGAIILRGRTDEFGPMVAILACASVMLWGTGQTRTILAPLVLWTALLVATAVILQDSPELPAMLVLFGAAATWFVVAEPILRKRRRI